MEDYSKFQKKSTPFWRSLFRPILLVAIAFHAGLLLIPIGEQKKPEKPRKKDDSPPVKLTRIAIKSPPPNLPPKATPRAAVRRAVPPSPKPNAPPAPKPSPAASPSPGATTSPPPTNSPSPSPSGNTLDPDSQRIFNILGGFQARKIVTTDPEAKQRELQEISDPKYATNAFTDDAWPFFLVNREKQEAKPGIKALTYIPLTKVSETSDSLPDLFQGYTITDKGEYGTGRVFQLEKGGVSRYVYLVPVGLSPGTIVVLADKLLS
jgi:hypothetical protein